MSKLKVFGMVLSRRIDEFPETEPHRGQVWAVVAATSQNRAASLLGTSLHSFRLYSTETGNDRDIAMATSKPETVFVKVLDDVHGKFIERKKEGR